MKITKENMRKLKLSFKNRCFKCGICQEDIDKLQFAHIKKTKLNGMGRGINHRYYDIKNNPDSYILICKEQHDKMDGRNNHD